MCRSAAGSTRCWCSRPLCLGNLRSRTWLWTAWFWRGNTHTSACTGSVLRQEDSTALWPGISANVCVHVCCVCSDGQKMSKRKKNYPDPSLIVQNYGADALRWADHTSYTNTKHSPSAHYLWILICETFEIPLKHSCDIWVMNNKIFMSIHMEPCTLNALTYDMTMTFTSL